MAWPLLTVLVNRLVGLVACWWVRCSCLIGWQIRCWSRLLGCQTILTTDLELSITIQCIHAVSIDWCLIWPEYLLIMSMSQWSHPIALEKQYILAKWIYNQNELYKHKQELSKMDARAKSPEKSVKLASVADVCSNVTAWECARYNNIVRTSKTV